MPLLQPSYAEWKSLVDRSHFHGSLSRSIKILTTTPLPLEPPSQRFEPFREFVAFLNAVSQTYTPLSVELDTGKEKLPKISLGKILEGVPQNYMKNMESVAWKLSLRLLKAWQLRRELWCPVSKGNYCTGCSARHEANSLILSSWSSERCRGKVYIDNTFVNQKHNTNI